MLISWRWEEGEKMSEDGMNECFHVYVLDDLNILKLISIAENKTIAQVISPP